MELYITSHAKSGIVAAGEQGYPNEVCGLLLGKDSAERRLISALVPVENSFEENEQYHRYLITPDAMFRAEKLARSLGLDVLGVYHSHPDAPARPSDYDRDHSAWQAWSYLIVSVREGKAGDLLAWKLREDRSGFDEEEIKVEA